MKLTKELCFKMVNKLYVNSFLKCDDESIETLYQLINEYFDNPPLKFEELHEDMWVWDKHFNRFGEYLRIYKIEVDEFGQKLIIASCVHCEKFMTRSYLENRFYRREVINNED